MGRLLSVWLLLLTASLFMGCGTHEDPSATKNSPPNTEEPAQYIDAQAKQVLTAMCDTLKSAKSFSFKFSSHMDELGPNGKLGQTLRESSILMQRPNMVFAHTESGSDTWQLYYKGDKLSVLRKDHNEYAAVKTPDTTEGMLDFLFEKYHQSIPLADLMFSNPYEELTENVQTGVYLGLHTVGEKLCHHLLFTQANVDWQMWIDSGDKPLPVKVVITRKNEPGDPQYTAELRDWNLSPSIPAGAFDFKAPAGVKLVDMTELCNEKGR